MSKSERAIPYLREVASLLNEHRPDGKLQIDPDGEVWDGGSGIQDERMREEMTALREQLQLEMEKIDWLLSLW